MQDARGDQESQPGGDQGGGAAADGLPDRPERDGPGAAAGAAALPRQGGPGDGRHAERRAHVQDRVLHHGGGGRLPRQDPGGPHLRPAL